MGVSKLEKVRINKTELDSLEISNFNKLSFYWRVSPSDSTKVSENIVHVSQPIEANNDIKGLIEIDNRNGTLIRYYRTVEDNDKTYIYFDFKNESKTDNKIILIKKMIINDKIYDASSFEENIYIKTEFKNINSFTISFFVLVKEDDKLVQTYISNEYTRKF